MLGTVLLHVAVLTLLAGNGSWVEAVYVGRIYPIVGPAIAFLPSLLPVSFAAILLISLSVWMPACLLRNLARWRRGRLGGGQALARTLASWVVVGAVIFHGSYLFWGYHYLRPPLEDRLGLDLTDPSLAGYRAVARRYVEAAVAARVPVPVWDRAELDRLVDEAMDRALVALEGRPPAVATPLKSDLDSGLLAFMGYSGVVSPLTLEAHVDFSLPPHALAFTAAHEKAHLAGFARERDANFLAWYALTHSDDERLRFAGYLGLLRYFLTPETRPLAAPLKGELEQLARYRAETVSPPVQRSSNRVYNVYLKANRMQGGINDYAAVVGLVQAWIEQSANPIS
jgi:hypothetical protein